MTTVREETFELLRKLGVTTMFGNPGSTEQPFRKDFRTTSPTSSDCRKRQCSAWQTVLLSRHAR